MPNLEYSVRFVLTTDSTKQIDEALQRMRESGSTIEVKLKTDTSAFTADMEKVKGEIQKVEQATEKLSRTSQKGSGMFKMYAKEIRSALNEFRATRNLDKAQESFADISARVEQFGKSMEGNTAGMQEFYSLTNQINSAVAKLNQEQNTSSAVLKSRESAERAVNEEVKRSAQVLATRARATKFEAQQARQATQQIADGVRGAIAELRRLSVQGQASNEQLSRLFLRTAESEEELILTTEDLTQAFARQAQIVQASNIPYKQKQQLLNQLMMAEEQSAQSIRVANKGLSQQENQVGDVSYAMLSFTRLLEDVPYGFRGFANNIQPTIFGLIQLNETTSKAALEFRKMHGKEMPLAQRAMINFKSALSSPINQLLLLTSVIAVAGTMIERWSQNAKKASEATSNLSQDFLSVFEAVKGQTVLDTDYTDSIDGLESYKNALEAIAEVQEETINQSIRSQKLARASAFTPMTAQLAPALEMSKVEQERLKSAKGLSSEAEELRKKMVAQAEIQQMLLNSEEARHSIYLAQLKSRDRSDAEQLSRLQDELRIEKVRQEQGEEAAAREKARLAIERLRTDELATENGLRLINLQLEMDLLRIREKGAKQDKEIRNEYDGILLSLQRQLEDEMKMSDLARLQIARKREIADVEAQIAQRRKEGEDISPEKEKELIRLVNERYDLIDRREAEASALVVANLARQAMLSDELVRAEQELLFGDEMLGIQLDLQIQQMEHQAQLADRIREIKEDTSLTDDQKLVAERQITREMQNQLRMSLMRQQADARRTVEQFLSRDQNQEAQIQRDKNQALLANQEDFEIQRIQLAQKYGGTLMTLTADMTRLYQLEAEKRTAIERKATDEINAIKVKGYLEGSMMIVGALQQLNDSSEATNKAQFERQKRFSASLATINTLLAVTQVLKDDKLGTFMKFAQATAMALTGFAQVRQILGTKYGSASTGGAGSIGAQSYGFTEVDMTRNASAGVGATMNPTPPVNNITVIGNVDREGIAFAVREGEDIISSRALF